MAKPKPKSRAKPKSKAKPPSTARVRRWVRAQPFRKPKGLEVSPTTELGKPVVVVSFPLPEVDWKATLTATEVDVVKDVLAGLSNAQIAHGRGTALRTVANQIASIFGKLGISSRLELSLWVLTDRATPRRRQSPPHS